LVGWTLVPGLLLLLCFVVLHWYPLAGPAWEEIKHNLAARHAEKERRYLESKGYKYVE
jgi:Na+/melibiose symporter-like transporter